LHFRLQEGLADAISTDAPHLQLVDVVLSHSGLILFRLVSMAYHVLGGDAHGCALVGSYGA
jgi:hypothetical protein